jgi:alkanesulfonate monooxygenase SsuD/methylene tetrahydromethanopterin reductase-like flavin-dependent oxidoreductase (luciferase family)
MIGDGWHPIGLRPPVGLHPRELADRIRRLRDLAAAAGREPTGITISLKAPLKFDDAGGSPRPLLSGPPAQVVEDLCAYATVGVEHFVLDFSVATLPAMLEVLDRFAAEVRPQVRA